MSAWSFANLILNQALPTERDWGKGELERESECVCVCVCVPGRERERVDTLAQISRTKLITKNCKKSFFTKKGGRGKNESPEDEKGLSQSSQDSEIIIAFHSNKSVR